MPDYPNNWEAISKLNDEDLEPIPYEEFMQLTAGTWMLPSSIQSIIRVKDLTSMKVTEYCYSRAGNARNKLEKLLNRDDVEINICNADALYTISDSPLSTEDPF